MSKEPMVYKSRMCQVIAEKLLPQIEAAAKAKGGMHSLMLKSFRPELLEQLKVLDDNPERQEDIKKMLRLFLDSVEETEDGLG